MLINKMLIKKFQVYEAEAVDGLDEARSLIRLIDVRRVHLSI